MRGGTKIKLTWILWAALLLLECTSTAAQPAPPEGNDEPIMSQAEMNQSAAEDYDKADAELNRQYKALIGQLEGEQKQLLIKAEQAWISFRDAEADFEASDWIGGSGWPMIYYASLSNLTEKRTAELKELLSEFGGR